ncbi:TetR/AcrR family transcriptional regulator [Listeria ilorinensis]|uniref:TetR/AcrR family transcriptional regulator n=1 Tax=Listeria ilorinensis TaxID=2867439 RepID=UPI001EF4EF7A|nr:TetR family transcriptional regulator [Listeria ilorinensis]
MSSRQQIIHAAIDVINEKGVHQYSLANVAARSGITKAAIFYHFKNKNELTLSLIKYTIEMYEQILAEEFEKLKDSSRYPFTESYLNGNLRQLSDDALIGLHGALLATAVSGDVDSGYWDAAYAEDFERMASEVGAEMAELLRYAIDGMWHAKILNIKESEGVTKEQVVQKLKQMLG